MKTFYAFLFFFLCVLSLTAQNPETNLEKYWNQRDRFRKQFCEIGPVDFPGNSLPFEMHVNNVENRNCISTSANYTDVRLEGGDITIKLGFYLSTLATEYKLLKDNHQDVTSTLNEIYYALEAFNRLDQSAEWYHRGRTGPKDATADLNGFYLRDDIRNEMIFDFRREDFKQHFTQYECEHCEKIGDVETCKPVSLFHENEVSQDQTTYMLMGLALLVQDVDDVMVKPTPADRGFKVITEAKAITDRIIRYMMRTQKTSMKFTIDFNEITIQNLLFDAFKKSSPGIKTVVKLMIFVAPSKALVITANAGLIALESPFIALNLVFDHDQLFHAVALANGPQEFRKQEVEIEFESNWMLTNPVRGDAVSNGGGFCQPMSYLYAKIGNRITGMNYFDPIHIKSNCKSTNNHIKSIFNNTDNTISIDPGSEMADAWDNFLKRSSVMEVSHKKNGNEQRDSFHLQINNTMWVEMLSIADKLNTGSTTVNGLLHSVLTLGKGVNSVFTLMTFPFTNDISSVKPIPIPHNYSYELMLVLGTLANIWDIHDFQQHANTMLYQPLNLLFSHLNSQAYPATNPVKFNDFTNILSAAPCNGFPHIYDTIFVNRTLFEQASRWGYGYSTYEKFRNVFFDGLEYCAFHNFYQLVFKDNLTAIPYRDNACPCQNFDLLFSNINPNQTVVINTDWKNPLIYDPNNSLINRRRFPNYNAMDIFIPDYLKHNLTVQNGGIFNADFDFAVCNHAAFTVEAGGSLMVGSSNSAITPSVTRIKKNSVLVLNDNALLSISEGSKLVIEEGATLHIIGIPLIILNGANAVLEIQGNVIIDDNSEFTFTGEGFVRYNVVNWQGKIQMGANASINLQGLDARNHKILEVTNSLFSVDNNGTNKVTIKNGRVDIADYSFLNIACALTVENAVIRGINLTQKHRGIATYGQTGIRIKNSTFEFGEYGVRSLNYFTSNSLIIDGCTFLNNATGIYSYARGITIKNCLFNTNTKNWAADAMDFSSKYTYNSAMNTATAGIEYTGNQNLDVYSNPLIETRGSGIINRGSTLHVGCTTIKPSPINKSFTIGEGIYADAYSSVYLCPTASRQLDGNNSITEFPVSIYTHRIVSLNLTNGGNNIGSNTLNSSFANRVDIEGSMWLPPTLNSGVLAANKNMWYNTSALSPLNVPASYNPSAPQNYFNYFLFTAPTGSSQFTFTDNAVKATPGINCPLTVDVPPFEALDMNLQPYFTGTTQNQVESILQGMGNAYADSTSPVAAVVSNWKNFIVSTWNTTPALQTQLGLLQYAYPQQKEAFGRAGLQNEMVLYPGETPQWVLDYIYTQEFLLDHMDTSEAYYPVRFGLALDNAIVYRTIKDYTQALDKLSQLRNWATAKDMALIDYWNCAFTNEQKVMNNEISVDELVSNVNSCRPELLHENLVFNTNVPQTTDSVFEAFTLSPNPTSDILSVDFNPALTGPTIVEVRNAFGSLVKRIELTIDPTEHTLPVPVGELSAGTYQLLVRNADGVYSKVFVKM